MTETERRLMELNELTEADMQKPAETDRIAELEAALAALLGGDTE